MRLFDRRLFVTLAAALSIGACQKSSAAVTKEDMSMGSPNAPVTVFEYASASCPHCARFNNDVFPQVKAKYIDTGKVRWVFREFLTPPYAVAAAGFLTARCAGDDKYFQVLDQIFHDQEAMFTSGDVRGGLLRIAQGAGLTEAQFDKCVSDDAALKALRERVDKYQREAKITSTPTFVVGDQTVQGEVTMAQMDALITSAGTKK